MFNVPFGAILGESSPNEHKQPVGPSQLVTTYGFVRKDLRQRPGTHKQNGVFEQAPSGADPKGLGKPRLQRPGRAKMGKCVRQDVQATEGRRCVDEAWC